ncbi:hypothetical protein BAVI_04989 [Neobacillus vireti LMG 21834]|uniref:Transposase n=1 Tax=Neobacillus vireti LMG 21834 TaxID=1131730 RepID=A0AB94ISJ5_9BACI|nr:hypothetical protein BAVI_04989 [Neobacillus vireti LMG 21834]KLT18002.1 hypothetical protein AA980_09960 [Neobacillus vireti]
MIHVKIKSHKTLMKNPFPLITKRVVEYFEQIGMVETVNRMLVNAVKQGGACCGKTSLILAQTPTQ